MWPMAGFLSFLKLSNTPRVGGRSRTLSSARGSGGFHVLAPSGAAVSMVCRHHLQTLLSALVGPDPEVGCWVTWPSCWFSEARPCTLLSISVSPTVHKAVAHVASTCCFLGLSAAATVAVLLGVRWCLAVALMCVSLMTSGAEHPCMCLLAICMFSLEKPIRVLMAIPSMKKVTFPESVIIFMTYLPDFSDNLETKAGASFHAGVTFPRQASHFGTRAVLLGVSLSTATHVGLFTVVRGTLVFAGIVVSCPEAGCRPCRLSCLAVCLALVKRCVLMYSGLPSFHDIVRPLRALLTEHLASCSHPRELQVRPLAPGHSAPARPCPDGEPVSNVLAIGVAALIEDTMFAG